MISPEATNMNSSPQFTFRVFLKLGIVLALILVLGLMTEQIYWAKLCLGAAIGMFFAEHFASTKRREFVFLICLPLAFVCVTTILPLLLQDPEGFKIASLGLSFFLLLLTGIVLVPVVACSVVFLSIISYFVFRLTGLRLLKFDWNSNG